MTFDIMTDMKTSRRNFIRGVAASVAAAPVVGFPAVVKLRKPNELLSHACIGTGNMALGDLNGLMACPGIHITALCDVDSTYLEAAKKLCPDARVYRDAFEMMAHEGAAIDSVNVSTPDHTHAQYVLEALKRGLNVYGQKPLCHELADCRRIEKLAAEKQAITQMGTQIMAWECDRQTIEAIKSGTIGEVRHVWLFSTRRPEPKPENFVWPIKADPVPATLDWKLWLGPAKTRPYSEKVYHPRAWRKWRDFGSSWIGDLALHLMSPVWAGLELGKTGPTSVVAEASADADWTAEQRAQYWPRMSHVTWTFPGVKASGMKPFEIEWCDGFGDRQFRLEPRFFPPAFLRDLAAKTPMGDLPPQGRVIEGTEGWLLSTHYGVAPCYLMKNGKAAPRTPHVGSAPSHWQDFVQGCLTGRETASSFAWTARLTEMGLLGNAATLRPGERIVWKAEEGRIA